MLKLQAKSRLQAGTWESQIGRLEYYDENGTMAAVIRVQQRGPKHVDVFEVDIPGKPKKDFGSTTKGADHGDLFDAKQYVEKECKGKGLKASSDYIPDTKKLAECHIERWYDKSIRSWTVVLKDKDDNQVGDSIVVGDKATAQSITKDHPGFNVRDYDAENAQRYRMNKPTKSKGK